MYIDISTALLIPQTEISTQKQIQQQIILLKVIKDLAVSLKLEVDHKQAYLRLDEVK